MVRGERLISYNDSNLRPLTMDEKKERVAFSRTIMQTPEYKEYLKKGYPRSIAIEKTAVNIQKNTKGKWFSVKRLPPRLQKLAKKYWVK